MVEVQQIWDSFCRQGDHVMALAARADDYKVWDECNTQFILFAGMYKMIHSIDHQGYPLCNAHEVFQMVNKKVAAANVARDEREKARRQGVVENGRKRREQMKEGVV